MQHNQNDENSHPDGKQHEAVDGLLDSYMNLLEQGRSITPRQFILRLGNSLAPAQQETLLQDLESIRLTFQVGRRIQLGCQDSLSGGVGAVPGRIGDFRILREIGRGGMGVVYEAEQESLDRHVAIKVLPAHSMWDPRQLQRFKRESRASARLHHTNIVPVFGVGEHDGMHYYVMQFINGLGLDLVLKEVTRLRREVLPAPAELQSEHNDLSIEAVTRRLTLSTDKIERFECNGAGADLPNGEPERAHERRLEPRCSPIDRSSSDEGAGSESSTSFRLPGETLPGQVSDSGRTYWHSVARIGLQVARALSYAHQQGVIHRDIKPSNLLLDGEGTTWVTDFGLAKAAGSADLTRTGDIVGTLRYLPPERLNGVSTLQSDVYGLGATLYELITLRPPFIDEDRDILLRNILHVQPPRPQTLNPSVPRDLETIVLKSISKRPEDRYESAECLAADLERFITDRPILARRLSLSEQAWRWCRRNPVTATMGALLSAVVMLLAVATFVADLVRHQRDVAIENMRRAEAAERNAQDSRMRAQSAEKEIRWRNHLATAGLIRRSGGMGQRRGSVSELEMAVAAAAPLSKESKRELANELIADLALTDLVSAKEFDIAASSAVQVDSKFEFIAFQISDSIHVHAFQSGNLDVVLPMPSNARVDSMVFSPDSRYLAAAVAPSQVLVWDTRDQHLVLDRPFNWHRAYTFLPDSRGILLALDDRFEVHHLESGAVDVHPSNASRGCCICLSPRGDCLAYFANSSEVVEVISLDSFQVLGRVQMGAAPSDCAWHPGGSELAIGCMDGAVYFWKPIDIRPHRRLFAGQGRGMSVAYSPSGDVLASCDWSSRFRLWDVGCGQVLLADTANILPLQFSSSGAQLGVLRDGIHARVLDIERSDVYTKLPRDAQEGMPFSADYHPSGQWFALATESGLEIWDSQSLKPQGLDRSLASNRVAIPSDDRLLLRRMSTQQLCEMKIQRMGDDWRIQPAEPYSQALTGATQDFDVSQDMQSLATANVFGAQLFKGHTSAPVQLTPHEDCRFVGISPDGKRIATGSHFGSGVKVWSETGTLVAELPIQGRSQVEFSPDGRWLATSGGECRIWSAHDWQQGPKIGGGCASFSPDGQLLVNQRLRTVRLYDLRSAWELASLESPLEDASDSHQFSPDGTQLVVVNSGAVWNLAAIRAELVERGLDWDLPPISRARSSVLRGSVALQMPPRSNEESSSKVAAKFEAVRAAWESDPSSASNMNNYAWALATGPSELRDSKLAVQLASRAVELQPDNSRYVNTLGVALFRDGQWEEAIDRLQTDLSRTDDENLPFDLYFLAMAYHRMGMGPDAKLCLDIANRWADRRRTVDPVNDSQMVELETYRLEAESMIQAADATAN